MNINPMTSTSKGVSFMVHRLGTEVGPLKQVRELLINSFEAIDAYQKAHPQDTAFKGQVEVAHDAWYLKHHNVRKAAFSDNGIGMDWSELTRYFNKLAESGKRQSIEENFGVGAKISTAAWNPYGVEVRSWKDGHGFLIRIAYDEKSDQYGLELFPMDDETYPDYLDLSKTDHPEEYKSPIIGEHGTMVVLLGKTLEHDTTCAPDSAEVTHKDYWFQHLANKQFYQIPHGISLVSRLAITAGEPHTRNITGYATVLREFKTRSGAVALSDATASWWILDEARKEELYRKRPYYHAFSGTKRQGHMAAVFRDELFDFTSHEHAIPMLQKFGILAGYNQVVIYVAPTPALAVTANLTRTSLVLPDGTGLPWNRWAVEFCDKMPQELKDYVERHQSPDKSETEYVREQIKKYMSFLQIRTHRLSRNGSDVGEIDGLDGDTKASTGMGKGSGRPASTASSRRPEVNIKRGTGQVPISELLLEATPRWNWVRESDALHLKSRAARFVVEQNFLEVNEDFNVFQELVDHGLALITKERRDQHRPRIETLAKQLYLTQLVWTIMSAMASFRHREGWRGENFDKLISEEALTAAVLPRVYLLNDMKRYVKGNPNVRRDLISNAQQGEEEEQQ